MGTRASRHPAFSRQRRDGRERETTRVQRHRPEFAFSEDQGKVLSLYFPKTYLAICSVENLFDLADRSGCALHCGKNAYLEAVASALLLTWSRTTLLYWRGWALHDRQARLGDRLALPPAPQRRQGEIVVVEPQTVEPIDEIDHEPGAYAGLK